MVISEQDIIESIRGYGTSQCLLANRTKLEQRVASAFFRQWKKWTDASAHDAPPPDYYSDKLHMMFDVLTIYDSEVKTTKRVGKLRNPILEEECRGEREARKYLKSIGIDADNMPVFYDCEEDGAAYDAIHTYGNYRAMACRIIKKHTDKLPLYQSNHCGYICGLFVFDCTEAYVEVASEMDMSIEYGGIHIGMV